MLCLTHKISDSFRLESRRSARSWCGRRTIPRSYMNARSMPTKADEDHFPDGSNCLATSVELQARSPTITTTEIRIRRWWRAVRLDRRRAERITLLEESHRFARHKSVDRKDNRSGRCRDMSDKAMNQAKLFEYVGRAPLTALIVHVNGNSKTLEI